MRKEKIVNIGGINGLGADLINTNSKDFQALQSMLAKVATSLSEEERLANQFLSIRFQMEAYLNEAMPTQIIEAGAFLEKYIDALNIKQKDFAQYIQYEESNLSALIKGKRKINPDLAIKFGNIFQIDPAIWLQIESKNSILQEVSENEDKYKKYNLYDLLKKVNRA